MPTYEVELSDGRIVDVEGDKEPTESDVMGLLGQQQPIPPIKLSPYEQYQMGGGEPVSGPFGPANPQEVTGLVNALTSPIKELPTATSKGALPAFYNAVVKPSIEALETPAMMLGAPALAESVPLRIAAGLGFGGLAAKSGLEAMQSQDPQTQLEGRMQLASVPLLAFGGGLEFGKAKPTFTETTLPRATQALKQSITEVPDAEAVRSDTGQPQETGQVRQGSQADSGGDLQQTPSGPPNAPGQAQVGVTSEIPLGTPPAAVTEWETPAASAVSSAQGGEAVTSPAKPATPDTTSPETVAQGPGIVGLGGAEAAEIPETGAGGDIYGISQRVREERARAGQVDPVESGEGINPQQAFERGEQLLSQGFDAPKALDNFLKTESATPDDVIGIRAYGERLAAGARNIEELSGTDSDQYREAYKALSDWDKRSKGLATAAHKMMVAHQGQVDLDTGSFTSLQRFYEAATDKPFKAPDAKAAEKIAKVNENAQKAVSKVVTEVNNVFQTDPVEPHVLSLAQRITDALDKTAGDALSRIKARRAEGRLFTGIDPVELADYAVYGASKIAKGAVEFSKWSAEMTADIGDYIKDHLKQIWDASNERLDETVERSVPEKERVNVKRTIRKQSALDAEKDALAAASRTVRENAIRIAKLDTKSRVAQTVADQELLEKQKAPELKAVKSAQQLTIKEAIKSAKEASKVDEKTVIDEQQKASERALKAAHDITKREAIRTAREASEVKERSGPSEQSKSAAEALESVNKIAVENAIRRAKLENKSRLEKVASEQKLIATQKAAAIKALKIAQEMERKATLRVAREAARVKEEVDLNEQQKATDAALEAANKVVRDNAVRVADAENKKRSATQAKEKKAAIEERRQAEVALRKSQNEARQAAIKSAKAERANMANPMKRVWKAVRGYLDKGETDQDTIRTKVATDFGMKPEQVYRLLARDERVKRLMDDMWLKQQTARRLKQNAKRWVVSLDEPKFKKFLESVPNAMFRAKVFGHMGVAFGTHAPAVGFMPKYWGDLAVDYGKMWGMGLSKTFYERQIQDLMNRKNFVPANRFGLDNHPERFEEYNPKGKTNAGGRSYTALKFIRQDIFDKIWDNLPKSEQTDEVGWSIANRINHMTGTLSTKAPPKSLQGRMKADVKPPTNAAKALFAPTLLFSRYHFIFGDTIQDLGILTHWDTATPGEKAAVKFDVNTKLWVAGTGLALLTANAGLLSATGSKQKINFTDPTRSDWLKFKAFGLTFSPGNAMLSMARIIPREIVTIAGSKKAREDENAATKAWEFARGQMSPFAGTATDLFFGSDYSGRPLPRKLFGTMEQKARVPLRQREQGVKPYTWPEYAFQQASPIPFQEGLREVWKNGWGMSDKQIDGFLKALEISGIMGATGARVSEDWETKKTESIYK